MITADTTGFVVDNSREELPPVDEAIKRGFEQPIDLPENIQQIIDDYFNRQSDKLKAFYHEKVCLKDDDAALEIFKNTITQFKSPAWHKVRSGKITASKGWRISRGSKRRIRKKYWRPNSVNNKYTRHGIKMEPKAIKKLAKLYKQYKLLPAGKHHQFIGLFKLK